MNIEWNKVTWYSKLLAVVLFVLTFYIGFKLGEEKIQVSFLNEPVEQNLTQNYVNSTKGFLIKYPKDFTLDEKYKYEALGPNKDISGVKFTIPTSLSIGTNLGSDSYISVEQILSTQSCKANIFLDQVTEKTIIEDNITYSFASFIGAGAGNRYKETVYALTGTKPCTAIRYFIHYSVFENYPPNTIKQFNEQNILNQFDAIRHSLIITK